MGATVTLLIEKIRQQEIDITPFEATTFLLGIYEDTGSLTFPQTTPRDLRAAAYLLEKGANFVAGKSIYSKTLGREPKRFVREING